MKTNALLLGLALLLVAGAASADSDGYFCSGAGYLAYELREWSAPERRHVLKIVFVGGADGISDPRTVALDDFQLHGMKCDPDRVVLLGWDRSYTVALSDRNVLAITSVDARAAGDVPNDYRVESFTGTRRSRSLTIPSPRPEHRYRLEIAYRERKPAGQQGLILHETMSTLVEMDPSGRVLRRKVVHTGSAKEVVH